MSVLSEDVAPEGDLHILIGEGDDQKLVRVSKTILRMASPFFVALFSCQVKGLKRTLVYKG